MYRKCKTNIDSIAIVEIILFYFVQEQKRIENSKSNYIEKIDELTKTKNFYAYCSELPGSLLILPIFLPWTTDMETISY